MVTLAEHALCAWYIKYPGEFGMTSNEDDLKSETIKQAKTTNKWQDGFWTTATFLLELSYLIFYGINISTERK